MIGIADCYLHKLYKIGSKVTQLMAIPDNITLIGPINTGTIDRHPPASTTV